MLIIINLLSEDIFVMPEDVGPVEEPAVAVGEAEATQTEESEGHKYQNPWPAWRTTLSLSQGIRGISASGTSNVICSFNFNVHLDHHLIMVGCTFSDRSIFKLKHINDSQKTD